MEQIMPRQVASKIYMIKKSAGGFVVSFRLGTDQGVRPGMQLAVFNEEGFRVGAVSVLTCTEAESEARVSGESDIKLGCLVSLPAPY
jgi:hypothetical protein